MIARKVKYIPGNVYNQMGGEFKKWKGKNLLGLDSSKYISNFTDHEITKSNIKFDIYRTQMWNDV